MDSKIFSRFRTAFGFLFFLLAAFSPAVAEEENAVLQLHDFQVLRTPHFDVYFALPSLEATARDAGQVLEHAWKEFCPRFAMTKPVAKISVFLYASQGNFQRSPIQSSFGQATQSGFTEPLKHRIVMWLSPSPRRNFYQLRLHLARMLVFQHLFPENGIKLFARYVYPEWIMTGFALYLAGDDEPLDQVALLDALFSGQLRPLEQLKAFDHLNAHELIAVHQYLRQVFSFLEEKFGPEKLGKLLAALGDHFSLMPTDRALESVYGMDENSLDLMVKVYLQEKWRKERVSQAETRAERLLVNDSYYRRWDFVPAVSPDGKELAFLSDRGDIVNLYRMDAGGGEASRVIHLGYGWTIDGLDLASPPAWSPDGRHILVKGSKGYRSCLFLVGPGFFAANEALDELDFDDYGGYSFAPDGQSVVFSGVKSGVSQLYRYYLAQRRLEKLITIGQAQLRPAFSRDGRRLAYVAEFERQKDLVLLDLETGNNERLARPASHEDYPVFAADGAILCTSGLGISVQLYRYQPPTGRWEKLAGVAGNIFAPTLSPDGRWVAFAHYREGRMHLFRAALEQLTPQAWETPAIKEASAQEKNTAAQEAATAQAWPVEPYRTDASLDFVFPFLAFNVLRVSDMTGVHYFQTQFGLFSGAIFDPGAGRQSSQVDVSFGVSGRVTYSFAQFFSLSLFGNLDYVEPADHSHHDDVGRSWDYKAGGQAAFRFELTPRLTVNTGYILFHRKQVADHPEPIRHHYWTGGVFARATFDNLNRRGFEATGGYALEAAISLYSKELGADYNHQVFEFTGRSYWSIFEDHIVMARLRAEIAHDNVPFLYDLGGGNLRGVSRDDYKGAEMWIATAEYRFPLYRDLNADILGVMVKDIRAFAFVEAGSATTDVLSKCKDWDDLDVIPTAGGGLRLDLYFLQHFALPLAIQLGKRLDQGDPPIFYVGGSGSF
jgi:hypothetical protein